MTERERERQARHRLAVLRHVEEVSGNVAATCRYYGISRNCYYKWLRRYEAEGLDGLKDRSSKPHFSPRAPGTPPSQSRSGCPEFAESVPPLPPFVAPMRATFVKRAYEPGPATPCCLRAWPACSSGLPRSCPGFPPCRRSQAAAPAAAQRRGRTSLTPASGGRSSRARKGRSAVLAY
jgi:hypothetical protein